MDYAKWHQNRYKLFNDKIDTFWEHSRYAWLREYADQAIRWNIEFGYLQIKAADFIVRIEQASLEYIRDWLEGKNKLEWSGILAHRVNCPDDSHINT